MFYRITIQFLKHSVPGINIAHESKKTLALKDSKLIEIMQNNSLKKEQIPN